MAILVRIQENVANSAVEGKLVHSFPALPQSSSELPSNREKWTEFTRTHKSLRYEKIAIIVEELSTELNISVESKILKN